MKKATVLFLLLTAASAGQSQTGVISATQTRNAAGQFSGTASFGAPRFAPQAIQNAPYSGEEVQEHQQTLIDGTHISQPQSRRMMYRDSQGRTRVERPMMPVIRPEAPASPMIIEITDPVNAVQYTLDTQNKIAHRMMLQPMPTGPNRAGTGGVLGGGSSGVPSGAQVMMAPQTRPAGAPNGGPRPFTNEKLGTQVIEGIVAEGQRQTMTIPAGSQGNDRDFSVVTETWTSPDLRMVIYRKTTDPRSGESIMRFANLSRNEPDPALFFPPADYQVVDETGPFSIHFGQ